MSELKMASWFEFDEHRHLFTQPDGTPVVEVVFTGIEDGRDNAVNCMVRAKVLFGADDPDSVAPIMEYQRCNLTNQKSQLGWGNVVKAISTSYPMAELESWERYVQLAVSASMRTWFEGAASHRNLRIVDPFTMKAPFLIEPFINGTGVTLLYGAGGTGKSTVAIGLSISAASGVPIFGASPREVGTVIYIDFEDSPITHDVRYSAILREYDITEPPPIIHYKMHGRLVDHVAKIRRLARNEEAVLIVVDSMSKARNTSSSDEDATVKLMNALESLEIPVLAIDHVTKSDNREIATDKLKNTAAVMAIGSTHSTNGARLSWLMRKMNDSTKTELRYVLSNEKQNIVMKQEPRSLRVTITNTDHGIMTNVKFEVWDTVLFEDFRAEPIDRTILIWMKRNGVERATATQLKEATKLDRASITKALRSSDMFEESGKRVKEGQFYCVTEEGSVQYTLFTEASR